MLGDDDSANRAARPHSDTVISLVAFVENCSAIEAHWQQRQDWGPLPLLHRGGSIAALIDILPTGEEHGLAGEHRFRKLEWLAPRVARHAAILQWAMHWSPVFPVAFGTLYQTAEELGGFMQAHEIAIEAFFQTAADKQEWTLNATTSFDRPYKLEQLARRSWPDWPALSPGTRYMRLCRERPTLAALGRKEARHRLSEMLEDLRPSVAAVKPYEGTSPIGIETKVELIASYAVLVEVAATAQFQTRMQDINLRAAAHDIAISLAGPWPPFGFRPHLG
ncbi:MAG TPA: GvpL/GvpF family gas vesicle protein [Methylovirgula sp.]